MRTSLDSIAHKWAPVLSFTALGLICILSFSVRIFSVIRYESVIHEFDPYFNFRTTKFLAAEGFYSFWNWFDDGSWYPLGRVIGGTIYPGLMMTAASIYWFLHAINIPIDIRNMCVFLAPIFSALTSIAAYLFSKEVTKKPEAGLLSALFMSVVPSYISRSVAGSYDNEGVAIFALVFSFYMWLKAVNTGSILWSGLASLAYFYMVASWGGYVFIINVIPIHVMFLMLTGRLTNRVYVAYSVFYVMGSLLAMEIPFVNFQVITSSEHMASHGVFILLQVYMLHNWVRSMLSADAFKMLARAMVFAAGLSFLLLFLYLSLTGKIRWSGRSMTLLDPTYAKKYIPIIASVSEHQPTTWSSFFFDLHILVVLTPVGLYVCLKKATDASIFAAIYGVLAVYFAGVMVRLMLVLAPAACILSGIGLSYVFTVFLAHLRYTPPQSLASSESSGSSSSSSSSSSLTAMAGSREVSPMPKEVAFVVVGGLVVLASMFLIHGSWSGAEAYSSPSIVMASRTHDGGRAIFDDYREAYYWLRMNTPSNAKVMSWWDYGYQITAMANRTVLVDNNTWNNTHIATVGMAMASSEEDAYKVMQALDVDYVLVIFGGLTGYSSDDINKFLWMVRIGGGVFPWIKEEDYFGQGQYRIDSQASPKMLNCLMYKLSYYRFDEVQTDYGRPKGFDRVRGVEMGKKNIQLKHLDEAFTSEHWIVRIYSVKKPANRGDKMKARYRSSAKAKKATGARKARN